MGDGYLQHQRPREDLECQPLRNAHSTCALLKLLEQCAMDNYKQEESFCLIFSVTLEISCNSQLISRGIDG